MKSMWVDTDFGFDDLWALLLVRHLGCKVAGVSLVAGNAPLAQVAENAVAAKTAYGFDWPLWQGAVRPLKRDPETAQRILGPTGMRSRGLRLEETTGDLPPASAVPAMASWLTTKPSARHEILALGPLTNIAQLLTTRPDLRDRINRIVWMGGSTGAGNHTAKAEFNAVADAESLAIVVASGVRLDIVDLTFCRTVTFGPDDLPDTDPLTLDLLGGYLDIALERGRSDMAIYDPLAALALCAPDRIMFQPCSVLVETGENDAYGATTMTTDATAQTRVSVRGSGGLSHMCLKSLERGPHGTRR
jgi:inosine-uridine nucleoside N-ribohydrolase